MEFLTVLLTGLLAGITPVGLIVDTVVEQNLHARLPGSDEIMVRIDNRPTHQALAGRIDRVRLATRGLQLTPDIRAAVLEVDTDAIAIDFTRLRQGDPVRQIIQQPLQGGVRLVLTEADINTALASEQFRDRLNQAANSIARRVPESEIGQQYTVDEITVDLLAANRIQIDVVVRSTQAVLPITFIADLGIEQGRMLTFENVAITFNGEPLEPFILETVTDNLRDRFDLQKLERQGITTRLLQWEVTPNEIHLAAFIHLAPEP